MDREPNVLLEEDEEDHTARRNAKFNNDLPKRSISAAQMYKPNRFPNDFKGGYSSTSNLPQSNQGSQRNVLESKKDKLNTVFGVRPWAGPVSQQSTRSLALIDKDAEKEPLSPNSSDNFFTVGNVIWVILFGWWIAFFFFLSYVVFMITIVGRRHAKTCLDLGLYILWPFGKCIVLRANDSEIPLSEDSSLKSGSEWKSGSSSSRVLFIFWIIIASIILFPFLLVGALLNWFFVVSIPMAKVLWTIFEILISHPTGVFIVSNYSRAQSYSVVLCTFRAFNILYFNYEVKGVNIVFLNLIPVVLARVLMIFVHLFYSFHFLGPLPQFFINIICSIPITFYIGTSIASIACQTNYTIGAILNATFGSVTELILFSLAIRKGDLNELILYSLTGSLLCDMLLLPGLSMIAGGIKYKEQQFNSSAAAISSLLLFVAVIGAFTPTIFYHIFGQYTSSCHTCYVLPVNGSDGVNGSRIFCTDCKYGQDSTSVDPIYQNAVKNLLYLSCGVLPAAYLIGLFFTFKTHKHIFDDEEAGEEGSAEWSIPFSAGVMIISITCFGLLAEDVVELLTEVLAELNLNQAFLGITVIALTPASTEIANAIKFALSNQISLSVSIGSASSIQVVLIQMPSLVFLAAMFAGDSGFHLIFPLMSVFAVILAVLAFNYISSEGKTNYFVGSSMCIMYMLLIASFYFIPDTKVPALNPAPTPQPPPPHLFQYLEQANSN